MEVGGRGEGGEGHWRGGRDRRGEGEERDVGGKVRGKERKEGRSFSEGSVGKVHVGREQ